MDRVPLSDAQKNLSATMRRISRAKRPVIVTDKGKDLVAVMSISMLRRFLEEQEDKEDLEEAKRRLSDPNEVPIPYGQVRRELGLD